MAAELERQGRLYAGLGKKHPALPDPDLRLWPPELGENTFLLCKPPSLWHLVTLPKDTNPAWFVPDLFPECHYGWKTRHRCLPLIKTEGVIM